EHLINDDVGTESWTTIGVDPQGNVHIAYFDAAEASLKYVMRTNGAWSDPVILDHGGQFCSMAFDPGGFPAISYSDYLAGTKLIRKNATGWGGATTIDSGSGPLSEIGSTALAFDPSGRAGIAYNIRGLLAYAQEGAGGVWSKGAVRNVSAQSISLARSAMDGTARISYYDPIAHVLRYDGPDPNPPGGGDPGCNPCDPCDPCPILRVAANVTPNPVRLGGAFVI